MRSFCSVAISVLLIACCAYLGAKPEGSVNNLRLRLIDAQTNAPLSGIARLLPEGSEKPVRLPGLFNRMLGLDRPLDMKPTKTLAGWHVVSAAGAITTVPPGRYRLEALAGLETTATNQSIDLTAAKTLDATVKLEPVFRPEALNLAAGNTHLHLQGLTGEQCEDYLRQIPAADQLKVLFISYLERIKDDASYITNRYPIGDLPQFYRTGVLVNNGEEHRHNFGRLGQGYGHVMLLDIQRLVKPVSIGPGLMGSGFDDTLLRAGIDDARQQGGTIIWCHNTFGHEDVPSALGGRLDALNIYDGGRRGGYADNYYKYLNVGLRLPISTGTDWFMYDFSRVYAKVPGKLTVKRWLEAVKAGRCIATNGPLLGLTVNGKELGETIALDKPGRVRVEATGVGRHDFGQLQLVHNGKVIHFQVAARAGAGYSAKMTREVRIDAPSWFAVRIDAPATTRNEFDQTLYAHSSPIYVDLAGQHVFDPEAARALLQQLEEARADIRANGHFSQPAARDKILAFYDQTDRDLRSQLNQANR